MTAIADAAGGIPLLVPALGDRGDVEEVLRHLDGIVLPGSPSNVEPHRYSGSPSVPGTLHDPDRDATTLTLIPRAVAMGVPLLGICRGFQEMNVAFGGSLLQRVHEAPGHLDHRMMRARKWISSTARRMRCDWSLAGYCANWPALTRSGSTRCTGRVSSD